jgi:hypothetical protein
MDGSPEQIVLSALTKLELLRDKDGALPLGIVDSYLFLYSAHRGGKYDSPHVLDLARTVLYEDIL